MPASCEAISSGGTTGSAAQLSATEVVEKTHLMTGIQKELNWIKAGTSLRSVYRLGYKRRRNQWYKLEETDIRD